MFTVKKIHLYIIDIFKETYILNDVKLTSSEKICLKYQIFIIYIVEIPPTNKNYVSTIRYWFDFMFVIFTVALWVFTNIIWKNVAWKKILSNDESWK